MNTSGHMAGTGAGRDRGRGQAPGSVRSGWLAVLTGVGIVGLALWLAGPSGDRGGDPPEVVVYAAQDQVHAEPIFREFEHRSGIRVRAVFDSEAVKTVGLANRLLAEQSRPRCDLFWGNEELRTRQLAAADVWREADGWRAFGRRSRRIVINTNLVSPSEIPDSLTSLTNGRWRGRVALAYPMFGTTATHFLALRQQWGEARWLDWCRALQGNQPLLVDGNSIVARLVARGEAAVGLTDSDDIAAEQRAGAPIRALPLEPDSLLIPNTLGLVRGSSNPREAGALAAFLERPEIVQRLVAAGALEAGETTGPSRVLTPDWPSILGDLDRATDQMRGIFLR